MSVAEAQEKIDSHELTRWRAYERIRGPIGPMRDYIVAAMISANIINALGGKVSAADLIPDSARLKLHMLRMMKNQQEKR
jgi:hypothetical protein